MLEGYEPIDFSGVFPPMELGQMRNRVGLSQAAMGILANSQFNKTPIKSLLDAGYSAKGDPPKRKQTLWGRTVDLLSTPTYGVANAVDDAIAGHQNNNDDSVLSDAGEIFGGLFSGGFSGVKAGMRGGAAPSDKAANPKDKIYLGDSLIRFDTEMSAQDAMNPDNREKVRQQLMGKKKNQLSDAPEDKYFYDFDKGVVEVTDEDIDEYFEDMKIYGLVSSMLSDPLNFISGGSKGAATAIGKGAEIPEIISGSANTFDGFKSLTKGGAVNKGTPSSINLGSMATGKAPGSYRVTISPGSIQNKVANPATGDLISPPAWFSFPKNAAEVSSAPTKIPTLPPSSHVGPELNVTDPLDDMLGSWASGSRLKADPMKSRSGLTPVAKIPDAQMAIANRLSDVTQINALTSDLLKRAATGDPNWSANLMGRLSTKYPGVPFNQTTKLIEHIAKIPDFSRRLGIPAERKKIIGAFNNSIRADAEALKTAPKVKTADSIINEASATNPVMLQHLVEGAKPKPPISKNPVRDAKVAQETFDKFAPQLTGSKVPAGIRDAAAYNRSVASGTTIRYSGSQQVQMWNHITHVMKDVKTPNRFAVANNILRQSEDLALAKGLNPMSGFRTASSYPIRLSQVLDAIGPAAAAMSPTLLTKILRGESDALANLSAEVVQKIEQLKAGEALVDGSKAVEGISAASKSIEDLIKGPLSAARTEDIVTIGSKVASEITRAAGGSPVAGKTAAVATKDSFLPKNFLDRAIRNANLNSMALISHPSVSGKMLSRYSSAPAVAKAINLAIGGPTPRQLGKLSGNSAKAVEWLGARFNAAYKNADMRPTYLRNAATAKSTVALRAQYLNNLAKKFNVNDVDLWNDALKGAQGRMTPVPGTPAAGLSKEIVKIMEDLFGSSGLKASVALENSVVGRSQLFMTELNANLKRFGMGEYQFAKKGDYAQGTTWLNSWEAWKIEKPLEFMFRVQNVVEYTVREKIMFDELVARFGTYIKAGEFSHQVTAHPRLANVYFGKEAASQVTQFVKNLKEISQPSSRAMQNFDKVLSKWKAGVTIYVPSHHIRNMIGDVYFNWMGGVNSARPYTSALKVMQSQRGRYEGLAEMGQLTSPDTLKAAIVGKDSTAVGKQTALRMKNGTNVTNDMVYVSAFQEGILPTTRVLEDIPDDAMTALDKFKPLGGRGQKVAHTISEGRDHYVRLAHYIDALKKSNKSFEFAARDAAATVRKWHPDGMDLTVFERNVMRRMFPFYSWTRKAVPLVVESLVANPGKAMVIPKGQYLLQNMLGMETGPMSDPFPYDQLFPDWIREKGIGPIGGPESMITQILGGDPGYSVINPGNPTMDLISQFNHPGKMAMGMVNPAARIPVELATGREAQTGAPFDGITDTDYLAKQIPAVSHVGRITGEFGVSDTSKENSSGYNMQNIINLITAMGAQNTGPYRKSAEFDLREYLKSTR